MIGERWALLVVRELVFGPKRFTDLRAGLHGISQNVLSQRLRDLEASGIVRRILLGPPASTHAYELTDLGRQLEPVLIAMSRWGALTPPPPEAEMSNDAFALALKALFTPSTDGFVGRARLELVRDAFDVELGHDTIEVARAAGGSGAAGGPGGSGGPGSGPELVIEGAESALRSVIFGRRTLPAAARAGDIRLEGSADAASAFLGRFRRPGS
ncbi:winged helix-turn-helix transcriptional regulator [Agromyces salentinus]|uniref:Winged helix-turn-helix transcriptional regulator n=1 Tax=Agromyces salentinus TaxID=269421 RepID=A0ABN2MEE1_9MICO